MFPAKETLKLLNDDERSLVIEQFASAKKLGLERFWAGLMEAGGNGHIYSEAKALKKARLHFGAPENFRPFVSAMKLYYILDVAGIDPSFVEIPDIETDDFACGEHLIPHHGVALSLSDGMRVFDTTSQSTDEPEMFFPLSARHVFSSQASYLDYNMSNIFGSKATSEAISFPEDGYFPAAMNLISLPKTNSQIHSLKGISDEGKCWIDDSLEKIAESSSSFHPFIHFNLLYRKHSDSAAGPADPKELAEIVSHPAWNKRPVAECMLVGSYMLFKESIPAESFRIMSEKLLTADPFCPEAHAALAWMGSEGKIKMSSKEVDHHFDAALAALDPYEHYTSQLLISWASSDIKLGRRKRAREKLSRAFGSNSASPISRAYAAWRLAHMDAEDLDYEAAAKNMDLVRKTIEEDLKKNNTRSRIETWVEWTALIQKEAPLPEAAFKDEKSAPAVGAILFKKVHMLFLLGRKEEGIQTVHRATKKLHPDHCKLLLLFLHEARLQEGDKAEADRIWKEIMAPVEEKPSKPPREAKP